jgi:DNA invertase Pin-like site-specific DNA recombinase
MATVVGYIRVSTDRQADQGITPKLDRLTRSVKDLCQLLELFERKNVALISVAESLDTGSAAVIG